jgi:nuclear mRNA export protein PCID2/THP1
MRYLIPCRLFLGKLYQPKEDDNDFPEYNQIIESIKNADFEAYNQVSKKYQKLWLKRGIYLLMDRVRIILWRTLVKRIFQVVGTKIELEAIEKVVNARGGSENLNECICIVANLIYEGYIKGYIFQSENKRTLVLKSKGDPFPKLESIVK